MKYKAAFFDFDGTLCSFKTHAVPPSAIEALRLARQNGVMVFLATGRHPMIFMQNDQAAALPFDGYLTSNGQYCYNKKEIIHRMYIPDADKRALVAWLAENPMSLLFLSQKEVYINRIDDRVRAANAVLRSMDASVFPAERCLDQNVFAFLFYGEAGEEDDFMKQMPGCKAVRWHPTFADIIPKNGGKDAGIDAMLRYYGIGLDETIAFGDAQNDLDMIRHVGTGVAMGNAADYLKEAADYITDSVDDDGIFNALRHFGVI